MKPRVLVLSLAVLVVLPTAAATTMTVSLAPAADGSTTWNGRTEVTVENGSALAWVPANARVHDVLAVGPDNGSASPVGWRAQGADALMVDAGANASSVRVEYDFQAGSLAVARVVAPAPLDRLVLDVMAPGGQHVVSPDADFSQMEGTDYIAESARLAAGQGVTVRVVDADEVGELPLLAAMVLVGALILVLTLAWHQLRPPVARDGEPMRFLDHLVELQARLLPPVLWFAFLNVFYFVAGLRVVRLGSVPLVVPTLSDKGSLAARAFDAFAARQVPAGVTLVVLRPIDAVLAEVQVALFLAFVTTLPLLLYELVAFIGPALRDRERALALRTIPVVLVLFLLGAWFGYVEMSPLMIRTLYDFAPAVGAQSFLAVSDLVSFALVVVLSFGAAFELPVLMYALSRFGVVKAATWRKYVRHAIVVIVVVAGIITPDPSPVSQMLVAVPVTALYLVGMLGASWAERRRERAQEAAALGVA